MRARGRVSTFQGLIPLLYSSGVRGRVRGEGQGKEKGGEPEARDGRG